VAKYNFTTRHKHLEVFKPSAGTGAGGDGPQQGSNKKRTREDVNEDKGGAKYSQQTHDDGLETKDLKLQKGKGNTRSSCDAMTNSSIAWRHNQNSDGRFSEQSMHRIAGNNSKAVSLVGSSADGGSRAESPDVGGGFNNLTPNMTPSKSSIHGDTIVEKEWLSLLKERPLSKNSEKMKAWLRNIIVTSDPDVALWAVTTRSGQHTEQSSEGSASSTEEEDGNSNDTFSALIAHGMTFAENVQNKTSSARSTTGNKTEDDSSSSNINASNSCAMHVGLK
jgi:hypothetical protein